MMPVVPMKSLPQKRNQWQQNACRITTRRRDKRRLFDLPAINFRQAINGFLEQLRRGMIVRIKFPVDFRALEPEIGAQINHHTTGFEQRHGVFGGDAVRQRQKNNVRLLGEQIAFGSVKMQGFDLGWLANFGKTCASVCPAFWREVTATNSTWGWHSSNRTSSSPE